MRDFYRWNHDITPSIKLFNIDQETIERTFFSRIVVMFRISIAAAAVFIALVGFLTGQTVPRTHRLEATPATVAYGYYWADAQPVLRIASGDILDVDTLLTNTPMGLQQAGVPPEKIQESLKTIVAEVTGERRGPGGHILTGPVYVEGAEPGDVLEVKILSISFDSWPNSVWM